MTSSTEKSGLIVEEISQRPQAKELRDIAGEITKAVFEIRGDNIFFDSSEVDSSESSEKDKVHSLLEDFRSKTFSIIDQDIKMTDDDLYSEIVLPIVILLIDRSA